MSADSLAARLEEFALLVFERIDFDGGQRARPDDAQGRGTRDMGFPQSSTEEIFKLARSAGANRAGVLSI
jgi:hypothetical protein